jgi:hypothetical protein
LILSPELLETCSERLWLYLYLPVFSLYFSVVVKKFQVLH